MAHKLNCPLCKIMLKEEGDNNKQAKGEYRVYLAGSGLDNKSHLALKCLSCNGFFEKWEI